MKIINSYEKKILQSKQIRDSGFKKKNRRQI